MKKLLVFFLAVSLFTACNSDKGKDKYDRDRKSSDSREKDDYKTPDDRVDEDRKDRNDDNREEERVNTGGGWSSAEVNAFVSNCAASASKPDPNTGQQAMTEGQATKYCNCMQEKFEKMFPDPKDAAKITDEDLESAEMIELMKTCLGR